MLYALDLTEKIGTALFGKRFQSLRLFWLCTLLVCSIGFTACNHQPPKESKNDATKNSQAVNIIMKDSFALPKVISITAANLPKTLRAGKPIIRIDSSNGGVPFFTNYGTEQGLALSSISCSMADHAGNLWFGTIGGGVSRYDGKSFTNYTAVQGLAGNYLRSIMQDNSGNIWFGSYRNGVSRYDGKSFTTYTTAQGLAGNSVRSIIQDNSGSIWFGTSGGVSRYDGKSFTNYTIANGLANNVVNSITQDKSGRIWFGTEGGGTSRYDGKSFTTYTTAQGLAGDSVRSIMEDKSGSIWFGTDGGGVSRYDGKSFTNYTTAQGLVSNYVSSIIQDKSGSIWFGTSGGVSRYDGKSFTNYTTIQGLANNKVWSIVQDKSGEIWFGTDAGGVSRYDGKGFTYYTVGQGLAGNSIDGIIQDKSGNIWIVAFGGGVSRYDGKSFMNYTTVQGLPGNNVHRIMQDNSGNIWFGTLGIGVSRYDGKNFTNYTTAQGLAGNVVSSIIQDKSGRIWFGTLGGGASRFDGKSFTNYTTDQGLASNGIECILQDKFGNIWFGTSEGVSRYDGKSFTNFTTAQGLASNSIECIFQDNSGDIWFGTNRGVSRYDGKSFTNFTTTQGLADNVVYAIVEDPIRNIIWFGTNLGLSGLKAGPSSNGNVFEIFNKRTGYSIKDLNTNAMCIDNNGIVWGGCGDGKMIRFDYTAARRSSAPLNLVIQNIKVNNEDICWNNLISKPQGGKPADSLAMIIEMATTFGKALPAAVLDSLRGKYNDIRFDSIARFYPVPVNLVLPYEDNNLSFDFVAIEPALPKQVRYQYKLEGYDKDWSPQSNGTTAVFGHIPEGSFTFKVKALSPYGAWSQTEYTFKVLPPWQRTWWAYAFYGICFLAGIYFTDRIRRRRVIEKERAQTREKELAQAKEIEKAYHELKTTQAQLIQSEKMASLGELTAGIAHEIQNPLNFVNNFSDVNKELIEEMHSELQVGNINEAISISNAIKENEEKISHHGKRADAIVKGMLQHSRISNGQKELANINAIADECLKLSYQGFRAKEKTFRANLLTDFDESIGKIPVIPQDMVRVFVNLFNNAFYTVNEKSKQQGQNFEPTVSVSTKRIGAIAEIRVRDNGNGIPQKIFDKIFQPFFTTKPTGKGTGLGLSMSYDIIKAHGGEIKVETKEGEFTEFVIQLPIHS